MEKSAIEPKKEKTGILGDEGEKNAYIGVTSELLFIFLPLMVLAIVSLYKGENIPDLLSSPEWSFAAAVLIGQSIVKFVAGISRSGNTVWQRIALVVSALIVLGLVPSLIVLSLMLITEKPPLGLVWTQLVLFIFGVLCFVFLGGAGHYLMEHTEE